MPWRMRASGRPGAVRGAPLRAPPARLSARARARRPARRAHATGSGCASPPTGSARPPAEYAIRAADERELGVLVEERGGIVLELVEVGRPHGEVREHPGRDAPERGLGVPGAGAVHRVRLERPVEPDALRGGPGIRPVEAGAGRRRVEPDERIHLADLPVARERDGRARVEQAAEPPRAIPALLAHVLHPGAGDEVGRAVPGLHRRGDAEVAEPAEVVGVQALDVHDPVAPVAGSVRPGRALDRVEREPDAGVARRVRVGLEPEPVELADHRAELAVGVARTAALPGPVRVVLEHQRRVRLDHVVGVELDRPEAQAVAHRRRVDGVAELRAERGIRPHRMEQRGDHAGGEHALGERALEERQLGERHLRLDHGGDAERRRHAHARHELAVPALGRVHRDVALQLGEPGLRHGAGVEVGDPARRLPGHRMPLRATPGDVAAVGDAEHAQRHPVQPHRVLVVRGDEDRPVGEPVEVARLGTAALDDGVDRVLRAHPVELGPPGGEVGDAASHLGEVVGALEASPRPRRSRAAGGCGCR